MLNLGATFTDVPGGTASWTFAGGTNYNDQNGDAVITISKANALVTVNGYTGVYDAAAHGATGTASGVGGVNLSASLNLGATFTDVPGGTASWTFAGGTNYNDQNGDAVITISKANALVTVNGYTGVYDAAAHGATGTASGVGGVNLSTSLNLGATFTDVPGGTAHWTFSGGTNYNDASGDVAITISKATASVTVNGYTGIYDGNAHGASGSASGVGGVNLSASLNLGAAFTDVPESPSGPSRRLRARVRAEVGLAISVGVARTSPAKVASAVSKPDGLLVVEPGGSRSSCIPCRSNDCGVSAP